MGWIDALIDAQPPGGEWPREPVYTAWDEEWGGEATTTSFCVEALARWPESQRPATSSR